MAWNAESESRRLAVSLTRQSIQSRIDAGINTALSASGWKKSRYLGLSPFPQDTRQIEHLGYTVLIQDSRPITGDRQKVSQGTVTETRFIVLFAYRLRDDAVLADYQSALTAEQTLINTVVAISQNPEMHCQLETVLAPEFVEGAPVQLLVCGARFTVLHTLPLS